MELLLRDCCCCCEPLYLTCWLDVVIVVEDVINQVVVLDVVVQAVFDVDQQDRACCSVRDVPLELVALTFLTTIAGDGVVPHLVEEIGNAELKFVDVFSYLL